ncbi:MAG: hypothetical protein ACK4SY_09070 [Pyrobaculum sp.]
MPKTLDLRGKACCAFPVPVVEKAIRQVEIGDVLELVLPDP